MALLIVLLLFFFQSRGVCVCVLCLVKFLAGAFKGSGGVIQHVA